MKFLNDIPTYKSHHHICLIDLLQSKSKKKLAFKDIRKYCPIDKKVIKNIYLDCENDIYYKKHRNSLPGLNKCDTCPYSIIVNIFDDKILLSNIENIDLEKVIDFSDEEK